MSLKVRRTRLISQDAAIPPGRTREVSLVVVATEDTYAAAQYLEALQHAELVDRSRVKVITLPTRDGRAALGAVIERLREYKASLDLHLEGQDAFWAVFDVDQQPPASLSQAVRQARAGGYRLAGSNPCFELWLLLHLTDDIDGIPAANDDRAAARTCTEQLHAALQQGDSRAQGYDKTRIHAARFATRERVDRACERARQLSGNANESWPSRVGTHVYRLVETLPAPRTAG